MPSLFVSLHVERRFPPDWSRAVKYLAESDGDSSVGDHLDQVLK